MQIFGGHNVPEYTVSEINGLIKNLIAENFSLVKIRGEISNLKKSRYNHIYFRLKDDKTYLNAICFAGINKKMAIELEEGLEIIAYGELTTYHTEHRLTLISATYAGVGALMKLIEERKEKLRKMGLLDPAIKKKIPPSFKIDKLGLITSKEGAVIHDILHRIRERFPLNIVLFPTKVQGPDAATDIIAGITYFNLLPLPHVDVIIIARGGGSVEDLFCFNDEQLALAVRASDIPIISAVGHESDHTIIDLVADLRMPTPTAAAEKITTPTKQDLIDTLENSKNRLISRLQDKYIYYYQNTINQKNYLKNRIKNIYNRHQIIKNLHKSLIYKKLLIHTHSFKSLSGIKHNFIITTAKISNFLSTKQINLIRDLNFIKSRSQKHIADCDSKLHSYSATIKSIENAVAAKLIAKREYYNQISQNYLHRIEKFVLNKKDFLLIQSFKLKVRLENYLHVLHKHHYRARSAINVMWQVKQEKVIHLTHLLSKYDYYDNLKRGYAILLDKNGNIIKNKEDLQKEEKAIVRMKDGDTPVEVLKEKSF